MGRTPATTGPAGDGFEDQARAASSLHDLAKLFTAALKPYGFVAYALGHLTGLHKPSTIYLTTWPRTWMELYAANGFIGDDPVVAEVQRTRNPFTWTELGVLHDLRGNRVIAATAGFGWSDGFVVPIHGPADACGLVALAAARLRMSDADRPRVVAMSRIVYVVARRLFEQVGRTGVTLSPREREALMLVAEGLDDAGIGAALGVTRTSAHAYVERAKRRLGAVTRAQAVALALEAGLL